MLLSGSIRFIGLVHFTSLVAAVLAIYGTACRIGFARRTGRIRGASLSDADRRRIAGADGPQRPCRRGTRRIRHVLHARRLTRRDRGGRRGARASRRDETDGLLALPCWFLCILTHRGRRLLWSSSSESQDRRRRRVVSPRQCRAGEGVFGEPGDSSGSPRRHAFSRGSVNALRGRGVRRTGERERSPSTGSLPGSSRSAVSRFAGAR